MGLEAGEEPFTTIAEMAAHYSERIREVQPAGPYLIGGASMGGMVAFDLARRLTAEGERVALVALMDTPSPELLPGGLDHADAVQLVFHDRTGLLLDLDGAAAARSGGPAALGI